MMLADSMEATVKSLPSRPLSESTMSLPIRSGGKFRTASSTSANSPCTIFTKQEAIRESLIGFLRPRIEYPKAQSHARNGKAAS